MTLRMANGDIIPYNLNRYASDLEIHFTNAENKINLYNDEFNGFPLSKEAIKSLEQTSDILTQELRKYLNTGSFSNKNLSSINQQLINLEKSFISDKGMYFGSWYRSIYASSDPFSGYAAWILPGLEYEIALKSSDRLYEWDKRYSDAINSLNIKMSELINLSLIHI